MCERAALIGTYLSGEVGGTTLGHLQDDGRLGIARSLERGNDSRRRGDVLDILISTVTCCTSKRESFCKRYKTYNSGNGKLLLASVLKQSHDIVADNDAGLALQNIEGTHCCEV